MTIENFSYRTDPLFLRNQFDKRAVGALKIPVIPKAAFTDEDFKDLLLLGFDRAKADDTKMIDRMVHFFLYDYKFERVWKDPEKCIDKIRKYRAVLSPDFSMYREMNPTVQLYNTFRNRWCGAYFAEKGIRVIPTVSWGDENTFDFCFDGIPKGSTVAVSTYMVSEHGHHEDQKEFFLKGYNEMLKRIEPERIICYNTPFPEMQGNIVFVDYELSSWKYQNEDKPFVKFFKGRLIPYRNSDIIYKRGYVLSALQEKGMGSAFGGRWRPTTPENERFVGRPGEIKVTYTKKGERKLTKIGDDGYAIAERHETDHGNSNAHSNPHDHKITWENNEPKFSKQINYPKDTAPEFKKHQERDFIMKGNEQVYSLNFKTIDEFKDTMNRGNEIEFEWKGKAYCCFGKVQRDENAPVQMLISEACYERDGKYYNVESHKEVDFDKTEVWCDTPDEILEYIVGGDRLRDVITQVEVLYRTI